MEKVDFIEQLKALVETEEVLSVSRDVNELKVRFEDFCIEEERLHQVAVLEAQEKDLPVEEDDGSLKVLKDEFYEIYSEFKTRKIAASTSKKLEQEVNLRLRKSLIERLRALISEEENIGVAISKYKEIHEAWKAAGDVERDKRQAIQAEFSNLLESFFFNIKIYRELKEHDLKRNFQIKEELIQKIKALLETNSIKEIEAAIKTLQNEFDETGPVPQEEWESLKETYWEAVKAVYTKIKEYYDVKREELRVNIEKKQALLQETQVFTAAIGEVKSTKEWEDLTKVLLGFQDSWKKIGFGTKKENEELWTAFRTECDQFFSSKKSFYETIRQEQTKLADAKRKLIDKVVSLKDSTDWKATTEAIVRLQNDWKKTGHAGQRNEQILWKEFRSACDAFFNGKQKHFEELDSSNAVNLVAKKELIENIKTYVPSENKSEVLQALRDFTAAFNEIGRVPFKEKDVVYNEYKTAIDAHYSKLKLEGAEKDQVMFQAKIDSLKSSPNAERAFDQERRDVQAKIALLKQEVQQYENNLGFFAKSKNANPMIQEIENKINAAKRKIEDHQRKLKMLKHE